MNRILVTGGCGFVGTSLIKRLKASATGVQVVVLDNLSTGNETDLAEVTEYTKCPPDDLRPTTDVLLVEGDIRDSALLEQCAKGIVCIVHLAANTGVGPSVKDPRVDMESNVLGTFNALEAARTHQVSKFIFASSGAPAGAAEPPLHEELAAHPMSPYGSSKLAGEGYCSAYFHTFGVATVSLRFGNVYGPRSKNKSSVIAKFIKQAIKGEVCEIYGDGSQTRDFIYIDDLIDAILSACRAPIGGEVFQIATGYERTVSEVAAVIKEELLRYDIQMNIEHKEYRVGDVKRNFSDITKARSVLDWSPKTDLREGIKTTISYFTGLTACENTLLEH